MKIYVFMGEGAHMILFSNFSESTKLYGLEQDSLAGMVFLENEVSRVCKVTFYHKLDLLTCQNITILQ